MLDDLRHHDPTPTAEENAWIDADVIAVGVLAVTALALAVILMVMPGGAPDRPDAAPRVAAAPR